MSTKYLYTVDVFVSGYQCTVRLNGYGFLVRYEEPRLDGYPVNSWIINGENTLEVEVHGLVDDPDVEELPNDQDEPSPDAALSERRILVQLKVERDPIDGQLGEGDVEILGELELDASEIDEDELPMFYRGTFDYQSPLGRWAWQDADTLKEDAASGEALGELLQGVHDMVAAKDIDGIMDLMTIPIEERGQAFGVGSAVVHQELRECYEDLFDDEDFKLAPLDPDVFAPRSHGNDRLLELVQEDGEAMIRQDDDDEYWTLPLLVGQIDGQWVVLSI